jgi:hypothetical protein
LKLYSGVPEKPIVFDKPGVVTLGCNIHDWMIAFIYVSESPYFAVTESDGRASLVNLPAGHYSVRVWHPGLKTAELATAREIDVASQNSSVEADWRINAKFEPRMRRAPSASGGGYR